MVYALTKLVHFLLHPLHLLLALGLLWLLARALGWRRCAVAAGALAAALVLGVGVAPTGAVLLAQLEARHPAPADALERARGAIILGGSAGATGQETIGYRLNGNAERLTTALALRAARPDWPIIITGGDGSVFGQAIPEPEAVRRLIAHVGGDPGAFIFEEASRNTRENAVLTAELLGDQAGPWLLVTSARHMPRAYATFRAAELDVIPYPVDQNADAIAPSLNIAGNFAVTAEALRELVGYAYYWARGWV